MASVSKRQWTYKGTTKEAWTVRYFDEKGIRRSKQFDQKKPAEAFKRKVEREIEDGTHVADRDSKTLAECGDEFVRWCEQREQDGRIGLGRYKVLEIFVRRNLKPLLGNLRCKALDHTALDGFYTSLASTYGAAGARERVRTLGLVEHFATKRGYATGGAVSAYMKELSGIPRAQVETFTAEEVALLLATAAMPTRGWPARRIVRPQALLECAIALAAFAGLRRGEILGLTRDAIDFDRRLIHVKASLTRWGELKGPKTLAGNRTIPMAEPVAARLRKWLDQHFEENESDLMFCQTGGKLFDSSNVHYMWKALLARAGLPGGRHFHALRHFAASWMIHNGLPITDVAKLMGHSKFDVTLQIYAHPLMQATVQREAIDQMAAAMPALPAPRDARLTQHP